MPVALEPPPVPSSTTSIPSGQPSAPEAPIKGAIDLSVSRQSADNDMRERALRPDSSRNKAFDDLDKRAGVKKVESPKPKEPDDKVIPPKTDKRPVPADSDPNEDIGDLGDETPLPSSEQSDDAPNDATKSDATTPAKPDGKKPNPWRLADEWKKKFQESQKENEQLKTANPAERPEFKTLQEKVTAQEKREKELVDELRYYNFEKHDSEFKAQFDEPYKQAWVAAVEEIAQFPVTLADGATRAATADDLLRLVNLPPVQARELAEEMFGKYADDVLMERKRVREKFDARSRALDSAKKGLNETHLAKQQATERAQTELRDSVSKLWEGSKKFALEHPNYGEYFKPIEGDQEGNLRLAKGFEMVERAMNEDPNDPKLSPAQRAEIVKRHAVIFHRAAAFGRTVAQLKAARAKLTAIEKELSEFKSSEPGEGNGHVAKGSKAAEETGMAGAFAELTRRAR